MKTILYLSNSRVPSETANSVHVMKMCSAIAKKCDLLHLVCIQGKDIQEDVFQFYNVEKNFKIHYLSENTLKYLVGLRKLLKEINPSVTYGRFLYGCLLATLMGFKTTFEIHSLNFVGTFKSKIAFWFLIRRKCFKNIVSITHSLKMDLLEIYKSLDKKVIVLSDAADEAQIENENCFLNIQKDKMNIGYVGSMHPGKGVKLVMEIASQMPQFNFHIVGGKVAEVRHLKDQNNLDNLYFYGFVKQSELSRYISFFDICLLPNQMNVYLEGRTNSNIGKYTSPLKMFEYMSYQKPIISSDLKVIREVLNEENAVLVDANDLDVWISSIKLLAEDKDLFQRISKKAYKDFISNYTWDRRAEKILESFNEQ